MTPFWIVSLSAVFWYNIGYYFGEDIHLFIQGLLP
jgi:hypothetical protein